MAPPSSATSSIAASQSPTGADNPRGRPSRLTPRKAIALQNRLRHKVITKLTRPLPANPLVAGADVAYDTRTDRLFAAVVVLKLPTLTPVDRATVTGRVRFPYIAGLLSFREAPALLRAFRKLRTRPHLLIVDGHGLAHPRRFGIASHLGLLLNLPTIGCAKSLLCGQHRPPGRKRGARATLRERGETLGLALRTRTDTRPVYVSVGHRIDLRRAAQLVLRCAPRYRLPEPIRQAHILVNQLRLGHRTTHRQRLSAGA